MSVRCGNNWGIVLSGGEGTRLRRFIKSTFGFIRPKQYCTLVGHRSMLRHTLDRLKLLLPSERILTIINRDHRVYAQRDLRDQPPETIITQPCGRETGIGILLPLLHLARIDPAGVVVIVPSDHFVLDESRFMEYVNLAFAHSQTKSDALVLFGIPPVQTEPEYGWIEKAEQIDAPQCRGMFHIRRFWEKPAVAVAAELQRRGCLWNTFVMVGSVGAFLTLYRSMCPGVVDELDTILGVTDRTERQKLLQLTFPLLPSVDFSREIIARNPSRFSVLELAGVYWSDWGNESRILGDIGRFHLNLQGSHVSNVA